MGASATLSATSLFVEPGQEVSCSVVVRNSGSVVDQFVIEVVGDPASWATVEPGMVNLLPGEDTTVTVRFAPPRAPAALAGPAPFGVRVTSREDPEGSVVEEGVLDVAGFVELTAEVVPAKVEAASRARYEVAVDNRGNQPVAVRLAAADPEDELDFRFQRTELVLDPNTSAFVRLRVRPFNRFFRGPVVRHRFQVSITPPEGAPVIAEATLVQRQLLPRWVVPLLLALLALAVLLGVMWFVVLRPAVRSAAGDAAAREAAAVRQVAQEAMDEAEVAKDGSAQAKQNADRSLRLHGVNPELPPPPPLAPGGPPADRPQPVTVAGGEPTDFRVPADAPIDGNNRRFREFSFNPPPDQTLVITDAIMQNPRGDIGTLRILRGDGDGTSAILEFGLANFRDLDHHWVEPLRFQPGERVVIAVSCQNPPERGNCTPSVSFSGRLFG